jgi:hypothetical protein
MQVVPRRLGRRRPGLAPLWSGGFVLTGSPIYSRRKFEFGFVLLFFWFKRRKKTLAFISFILSFFLFLGVKRHSFYFRSKKDFSNEYVAHYAWLG